MHHHLDLERRPRLRNGSTDYETEDIVNFEYTKVGISHGLGLLTEDQDIAITHPNVKCRLRDSPKKKAKLIGQIIEGATTLEILSWTTVKGFMHVSQGPP